MHRWRASATGYRLMPDAPCKMSSRRSRKCCRPQSARLRRSSAEFGNLLAKVDTLIIGGGMANTFLAACGHSVGKSLCERDLLPTAREIMAKAKAKGHELVLPVDV